MHAPPSPPPPASQRFPDDLRDEAMPDPIPPGTAVDLVYRKRSRLTGTVGACHIDLTLDIATSSSAVTGSLDGAELRVAWSLSDNSGGDPELPASMEGAVGGRPIRVHGVFRLDPGFTFDRAFVDGDVGGLQLKAAVERAEGRLRIDLDSGRSGRCGRPRVHHLWRREQLSRPRNPARCRRRRGGPRERPGQRGPERGALVRFVPRAVSARGVGHGSTPLLPVDPRRTLTGRLY